MPSALRREPVGITPIRRGNRSLDTKSSALTSVPEVPRFVTAYAVAAQRTALKLIWRFSFLMICRKPEFPSSPCEYWVYRYEGALNGIGYAVVLLSYPKNLFRKGQALRLFLCSDPSFSDERILSHYNHHADRYAVGTNRDERVQTSGRLSYKI